MAEMIPDRLPQSASAGEKRVFAALQRLPDDCIVYYEPVVKARYPDFVVLMPDIGLLVIEAKGWYPNYIRRADLNDVVIEAPNQPSTIERHPLRQAREYMFGLMDVARRHPASAKLLHKDGDKTGRFVFPFGKLAVLNNITREQLRTTLGETADAVFPQSSVMTRDELVLLETLDPSALSARLKACFDPWWPFPRLDDRGIDIVRAVLHPEAVIKRMGNATSNDTPHEALTVLDYRQERFARSIGDGHRVLYGVAGSGKSVILLSRARLLAEDPSKRILMLCFNKSLASYFRSVLSESPAVTIVHFHGWGSNNGVRFDKDEDEEDYGLRFLDRLEQGDGDSHVFDAVLIDESQDFAQSWFKCAKAALKEPEDGDLIVVGDGSQSLYRRRKFTWRDAGVSAIGRTINLNFDLNRNYRNTREILKFALPFAAVLSNQGDDASLQSVPIDPATALRRGLPPRLLNGIDREDECSLVAKEVSSWLSLGIPTLSGEREPIQPSQIGIFYPRLRHQDRGIMNAFLDDLRSAAPVVWFNQPGGADIGKPGIKVQTILSSKGLQYKAVIVIWTDLLPFNSEPEQVALDRGQLYVAMTRAEDLLVLTRSGASTLTEELERQLG
jgi:hypothetical protein